MSNLLQVEKVSKEDYHQWLSNPVTKAMTAHLTNECLSLNQLSNLPNPLTLEAVNYQRADAFHRHANHFPELEDAAEAHRALEARKTVGSTILVI